MSEANVCPHKGMMPVPPAMEDLPIDRRGFVVPWFVQWIEREGSLVPTADGVGHPEFRIMNRDKWMQAVIRRLCWVCGGKMGSVKVFVAGPMCGVNRTSSEPPSHRDCAIWSAMNCPFLSNPRMIRREDEVSNNASLRENAAGIALSRNPGVTMLWYTRQYEVFHADKGPLIQMGEPEAVEWYACGKPATLGQVRESIESGIPNLETIARQEKGGLAALEKARLRLDRWLPKGVDLQAGPV